MRKNNRMKFRRKILILKNIILYKDFIKNVENCLNAENPKKQKTFREEVDNITQCINKLLL